MTDTPDIALVEGAGQGRFQVRLKLGATTILADEPASVGGLGAGPNPYELMAGALGACTAMTVRLYAEHKGWPLTDAKVAVTHSRPTLQGRDLFTRAITFEGPLDDAQRERLMQIADRCPVHLTLSRGSDVESHMAPVAAGVTPSAGGQHESCMEEACAEG